VKPLVAGGYRTKVALRLTDLSRRGWHRVEAIAAKPERSVACLEGQTQLERKY